ncbi:hypothetical protein O3G_MSEX001081, partial [Manduca sexta]
TVEEWRLRLEAPSAGLRAVAAVRPVFAQWLDRRHGAATFRLTQMLTGHGCFAWDEERSALVSVVGGDLSLPAVVASMVGSREAWRAVAHFCEVVLSQKEDPSRRQRRRRRRRVDD